MRIVAYLLAAIVFSLPLMPVSATDEHVRIRLDPNCTWAKAAAQFKKVIVENKGNLEPLHLKEGLVLLATAEESSQAVAIRKAAKILLEDFRQFHSEGKEGPCNQLLSAAQTGKLKLQLEDTAQGVLLAYFSTDQKVTDLLLSDCCDYCICPSTNSRCSGCC